MLRYPEFEAPFAPLEEAVLPWTEAAKVQLLVKREDRSHPFISGNKWRKLKYPMRTAWEQGKSHLITFGGAYSNHLLATAAAGAKYGFRTTGIVRGEEVNNPILHWCKLFGMELKFISRTAYQDKETLHAELEMRFPEALLIPEGGNSAEGMLGVAELVNELPVATDHLFTAVGTGATLHGLIAGRNNTSHHFHLHGIWVLKGMSALDSSFAADARGPVTLHHDFHFGGYAKTSPELWTFIQSFATQTGILLDQVYEGKMMYAVKTLLEAGVFPEGSSLVAIHNGGLAGLVSKS